MSVQYRQILHNKKKGYYLDLSKIKGELTGLKSKEWRAMVVAALKEVGEYWHANKLKKKFTTEGAREYQYRERSERYQKQKMRMFGHNKPLVKTGSAQLRAQSIRAVFPSKSGDKVTIRLSVPTYMYQYKNPAHDKMKEIRKMSGADRKVMAKITEESIKKQIGR